MLCSAQFFRRRTHLAVAASLALTAGCAGLAPPSAPPVSSVDLTATVVSAPTAGNCLHWYNALDSEIERSGTRDAGATQIASFPQLRADRFAASFRDALVSRSADGTDRAQLTALLGYLRELDIEARMLELANLPGESRTALKLPATAQLRRLLEACSGELTREIFADSRASIDLLATLATRLTVPDRYVDWKRALGLYPLTSLPFLRGINAWQRATAQRFAQSAAGNVSPAIRYVPHAGGRQDDAAIQRYAASPRNALGISQLSARDWASLLAQYAPVFEVETPNGTSNNADRFGALHFTAEDTPSVDIDNPVVYQRVAFTRYRGQTLTQLVYGIWFPERPASQMIDLLAGHLDGVIIRITLDQRGIPLLVDSIHACGCYHLFFPTPRLSPRAAPQAHMEWAFIPATLPLLNAGQRLQLRLASASHYLLDIRPFDNVLRTADIRYNLRDDNELRSLPIAGGGRKSVFGSNGIIEGTERDERFLFWPMGIASPGAMRQWGTHATAFVGRRHFDDADLIEQRFEIKPE